MIYIKYDNMPLVKFKDLDKTLPKRKDFLIDAPTHDSQGRLLFLPIDSTEVLHNWKQSIVVFGVLPNSDKVGILINNIPLWFLVKVPAQFDARTFGDQLKADLDVNINVSPTSVNIVEMKQFHYYDTPQKWVRLDFGKSHSRKKALEYCKNQRYECAFDHRHTIRSFCSEHKLSLATWKCVRYTDILPAQTGVVADAYGQCVSRVPLYVVNSPRDVTEGPQMADPSLILGFDTEVNMVGKLRNNDMEDDLFMLSASLFRVSEGYDATPLCVVTFSSRPLAANAYPSHCAHDYVVECDNVAQVVAGFIHLVARIKPEMITEYNGFDFDWPKVISVFETLHFWDGPKDNNPDAISPEIMSCLQDCKYKMVRMANLKVDAKRMRTIQFMKFPGYVCLDALIVVRKKFPKEFDNSLATATKRAGVMTKKDLPISTMFRYYRESVANPLGEREMKQMAEVADYCKTDSACPVRLLLRYATLMEIRELASRSYTTIHDACIYADGLKVRNLSKEIAHDYGVAIPDMLDGEDTSDDKEKYKGATVMEPLRGYYTHLEETPEPTSKVILRYLRLMKQSKMPAFNTTFEIITWKKACQMQAELCRIKNDYVTPSKVIRGWSIANTSSCFWTHITTMAELTMICELSIIMPLPSFGLDFQSLYPSIIMGGNFSPEMVVRDPAVAEKLRAAGYKLLEIHPNFRDATVGWIIQHENDPRKMGIYGIILKRLFDERVQLKKQLAPLMHQYEDWQGPRDTPEYRELLFQIQSLNAKQLALKVFMNTFYGEAGNQRSIFFNIYVSAGITEYGRNSLERVRTFVTTDGISSGKQHMLVNDFTPLYGDTDSIYPMPHPDFYRDLIDDYRYRVTTKAKFWESLVERTMTIADQLRNDVNDMLVKVNGHNYLRMAYEEVLWPHMFILMKTYMGVKHESKPHPEFFDCDADLFFSKAQFIRGFRTVKRNTSAFAKEIVNSMLHRMFMISNTRTIAELIDEAIIDARVRINKTPISAFECWRKYNTITEEQAKAGKGNKLVMAFVKRMMSLGLREPANGEHFATVFVERDAKKVTNQGKKTDTKKADILEYSAIFGNLDDIVDPSLVKYALETRDRLQVNFREYMSECLSLFSQLLSTNILPVSITDATISDESALVKYLCKQLEAKYLTKNSSLIDGKPLQKVYRGTINGIEKYFSEYDSSGLLVSWFAPRICANRPVSLMAIVEKKLDPIIQSLIDSTLNDFTLLDTGPRLQLAKTQNADSVNRARNKLEADLVKCEEMLVTFENIINSIIDRFERKTSLRCGWQDRDPKLTGKLYFTRASEVMYIELLTTPEEISNKWDADLMQLASSIIDYACALTWSRLIAREERRVECRKIIRRGVALTKVEFKRNFYAFTGQNGDK